MTATFLWAILNVITSTSTELVELFTDVSGSARGAAAVGFDPAAAGRIDGFELQLRQRGQVNQSGVGAAALYGTVPIGPLAVFGGYEFDSTFNPGSGRGTFGLSWALCEAFWLGANYRSVSPGASAVSTSIWDVGLFAEPMSWLTFSLGIDGINGPAGPGVHVARALRLGLGLRPLVGVPWLTVAADTRLVATFNSSWAAPDNRILVEVSPVEGVHANVGYLHQQGDDKFWAGVGIDLFGIGLWGGGQPYDGDNVMNQEQLAITLKSHPSTTVVHPYGRTVEVALDDELMEHTTNPFNPGKAIPMVALQMQDLATDASVQRVLLRISPLHVGLATVQELREAIAQLRGAGKEVVAQLQGGDDKTYMVAAAAQTIELDPLGILTLDGFSVTRHYFAAMLQKVGLRFDAVGVGKYKSAPDALTATHARPEDKEVEDEILGLAQGTLVAALKENRHFSDAQVAAVFDMGILDSGMARAAGLVDRIVPSADPNVLPERRESGLHYADIQTPSRRWGVPPVVAVIPVVGTIVVHSGDNVLPGATASAAEIIAQIDAAAEDAGVVGAVLRVDSPGGDVYASELIWRAAKNLAAKKPLVVSMGDVAASGGYYIASPAHAILAQPNTVTGSIGIFSVKLDIHGLLDWVGVRSETYKSTPRADWESVEMPLSDADRARAQRALESLYTAFVERVASGRHLAKGRVREIAEGRVYTGARAKELGLVDAFGGLADAVRLVRERAGVPDGSEFRVDIPDKALSLAAVVQRFSQAGLAPNFLDEVARGAHLWDGRPLALMPYTYEVGL